MTIKSLPAIWLIVLIVGLPQLSETVYSPSLPDIANALSISEAMAQYTLTIYLLSFGIGTLFWGKISDIFGRKPCVLAGIFIFILGSFQCYISESITMLMIGRFIQAFGGSIGSVLGQAISRDAFHGPSLGKVYSSVGSALALFPAIGPVIGGLIAEQFHWSYIFLLLILFAIVLSVLVMKKLPETHHSRTRVSMFNTFSKLVRDKKILAFCIIISACNGIYFSYFAEGSFYLIERLGLSPSQYGLTFIMIAFASMLGGIVSKRLHSKHSSTEILFAGMNIMLISTAAFTLFSCINAVFKLPNTLMIFVTIISQMITIFGMCMTISNSLALALSDYKYAIGTASSIFGFAYYCITSFLTFLMGYLHDGSMIAMPMYFLFLSIVMNFMKKFTS